MQPKPLGSAPDSDGEQAAIRAEIERLVGPKNFDNWFRTAVLRVDDDTLTVGVSSPFLLNWMQRQFRSDICSATQNTLGASARVSFEVDATIAKRCENSNTKTDRAAGRSDESTRTAKKPAAPPSGRSRRRFADLADFISGKCNELAYTATRQVCAAPGAKFNPLFLYGGVGTGKTHLLEGIYKHIRRQFPALNTVYLTAETFTNYFTGALREKTTPGFRRRFRSVDVLLVDDIDFFNAKRVIQEEFLHTFKQLDANGCQIVLAADRHPRLFDKLSDEMTTRLLSGLVCRIESPDVDTRRNIVTHRAKSMDAKLSPEALNFVAQRFKNNVRELIGALNCLETYFSMTGRRISLAAARSILADLERDCIRVVSMSDVEQTVCGFFGIAPDDLKSSRRHRWVSQPRMLAMYLARKHTHAAYNEIGKHFGGRNHSTVMTAEKKVIGLLEQDKIIQVASQDWPLGEVLEALEQQLRAG